MLVRLPPEGTPKYYLPKNIPSFPISGKFQVIQNFLYSVIARKSFFWDFLNLG